MATALQLEEISKTFPGVIANDHINLEVRQGEIHGLLGENGAGKSTLMNILFGLYRPDSGNVFIQGKRVDIQSPRDALNAGIGMVHQHFMLIPVFTAVENLILGDEPQNGIQLDIDKAVNEADHLSQEYGLFVEPLVKVKNMSVCQQQRLEILKALRRKVNVLILDEPTSILTPQEINELYQIMDRLRDGGCSIIFISHKLNEILTITDRITVLRAGKVVGSVNTKETNKRQLTKMMVGREVMMDLDRNKPAIGKEVLKVKDLLVKNKLGMCVVNKVNFCVHAGEIVGIAGIDGNGRKEIVDVLSGLRPATSGEVFLDGEEVTNLSADILRGKGFAHIPEDRQRRGLLMESPLHENAILGFQERDAFNKGPFLIQDNIIQFTKTIIKKFDVRASSVRVLSKTLSGGNQQKLIFGRELSYSPKLLIAAEPSRGVDVGATEFMHKTLIQQARTGTGILLCSSDLDETMAISDRILVLYKGEIVAEYKANEATKEEVGLAMAGGHSGEMDERIEMVKE